MGNAYISLKRRTSKL